MFFYRFKQKFRSNPLAGIATFASPMEDPHITTYVNSDEEDQDDFEIKSDDNLVAVAKVYEVWNSSILFQNLISVFPNETEITEVLSSLSIILAFFKDEYTLEVYLYNEAENDWYVHHDYILDVPPLCLEPIYFDPGSDDKKGNLLALGGIDGSISIWDLDLVNSVIPTVTLGKAKAARFFFDSLNRLPK